MLKLPRLLPVEFPKFQNANKPVVAVPVPLTVIALPMLRPEFAKSVAFPTVTTPAALPSAVLPVALSMPDVTRGARGIAVVAAKRKLSYAKFRDAAGAADAAGELDVI